MIFKTFQDILPFVEKPSRYLGSEINTIKKDPGSVRLKIALAFPELYEIGTSHFGLQILYHILNSRQDIAAERVFAPATDMAAYLKSSNQPLPSLESRTPLNQFDIVGFSLLYELNFTNVLYMLDLAGISFSASDRTLSDPILIAGGPCTCNPEPIADFFDAIVVGDGEEVVLEMSRAWIDWKQDGGRIKDDLFRSWSKIDGVYIPSFYHVHFDPQGFQHIEPVNEKIHSKIKRAVVTDLDRAPAPVSPVIPYGKPVHDRLRIELARGCTRGCRFCQAGMIYRPVRERSIDRLLDIIKTSIETTGYEELSLLSLSTGDFAGITGLMENLMPYCESQHIAVSLPSIRAGTLTPELMKSIRRVRKTGFTIAPEAGSQRLRDVINKNITEKEIVDTVSDAFQLGWKLIKLYFMIGLPTETEDDLQAIVDLVEKLRKIKGPAGRLNNINVSLTTFIPKPHTPLQWAPQLSVTESMEKLSWLKNRLKKPGVNIKWQHPETSLLEGLFARGDRRLGRLLLDAYSRACRFDGWSDCFNYDAWKAAFQTSGIDPKFYTTRRRRLDEPLPWDHIDSMVKKDFLVREWEKAVSAEHTPDCRNGNCSSCGVCDFKRLLPIVNKPGEKAIGHMETDRGPAPVSHRRISISYAKKEDARFFGHLEMVNIFLRAFMRAKIPVEFSRGFHPMPRISFDDPLPIGMESVSERFYILAAETENPENVVDKLNAHLPEGLRIQACRIVPPHFKSVRHSSITYMVQTKDSLFDKNTVEYFKKIHQFPIFREDRKKGRTEVNLKSVVLDMEWTGQNRLTMTLKNAPGFFIRPAEILKAIFNLSDEDIKLVRTTKIGDSNG